MGKKKPLDPTVAAIILVAVTVVVAITLACFLSFHGSVHVFWRLDAWSFVQGVVVGIAISVIVWILQQEPKEKED